MDIAANIVAALKLLEEGQAIPALDRLLETWRETRSPQIADRIELLSEQIDRSLTPIAPGAGTDTEFYTEGFPTKALTSLTVEFTWNPSKKDIQHVRQLFGYLKPRFKQLEGLRHATPSLAL